MKKASGISFRPGLLPTLVTLVLVPLLGALGFWQLDRAEHKRALQRQFAEGASTLIDLPEGLLRLQRYQRVSARGRFDAEQQFLLDNMLHNGVPGFHVLSIFEVAGNSRRLVVNRGWVPAGSEREVPPELSLPGGELSLSGRLDLLPRPGLKLDGKAPAEDARWPRLVVFPDMAELAEQLPYELYPMVLLLDESEAGGYQRDWSALNLGPERHIAYAVQWFALAATLVVIFVVVNLKRSGSE